MTYELKLIDGSWSKDLSAHEVAEQIRQGKATISSDGRRTGSDSIFPIHHWISGVVLLAEEVAKHSPLPFPEEDAETTAANMKIFLEFHSAKEQRSSEDEFIPAIDYLQKPSLVRTSIIGAYLNLIRSKEKGPAIYLFANCYAETSWLASREQLAAWNPVMTDEEINDYLLNPTAKQKADSQAAVEAKTNALLGRGMLLRHFYEQVGRFA
ncbi:MULTISPECIES: hypothetical protein [unclassified Lentimonas]|uniref:hypothetical protein n=1 Tax=unclassified Lentimonas TaxID=2630993 RepID=UPI001329E871|nr:MULTISPECIES: hypothetical protein [unclassified Lentimonas]CAA6677357.1 Unannotated [Lentimonas sp. CC4]CAA6686902.1 Unannotated [Lentimonas sp. CC6]CAA6690085.1 Unannotated [Lentimonas sp. CC19]CAA6690966.1 Unannotated [Lentimonas sp. CC10]CAA7070695.1 Unannotated [Lentimonas sp. CC11]